MQELHNLVYGSMEHNEALWKKQCVKINFSPGSMRPELGVQCINILDQVHV